MNALIPQAQQPWHPRCQQGQAAEHHRSQSTVKHRDHARQDSRLPVCHSSSTESSLQLNQSADQQNLEPSPRNQNGTTPPPADPMDSRQAQALVQLKSKLAMMQNEKQKRKKLWMAAVKPPMYTVAYIPILVRCRVGSLLCRLIASPSVVICSCMYTGFSCSSLQLDGDISHKPILPAFRSLNPHHCLAEPQVRQRLHELPCRAKG